MHYLIFWAVIIVNAISSINAIIQLSTHPHLSDLAYTIDLQSPPADFPHFWERCVGSGHATLTLRDDWQQHLNRARSDLGFHYVRFHGLLDDDMSVYLGPDTYSFYNVDKSFDFLLSTGMQPIVELGFMPEALASNNTHVFHYRGNTSPPKSLDAWGQMISALIKHLIDRYSLDELSGWYFEVWNEPNLHFWSGTQEEYFQFYNATAFAIKTISSRLRVGGPAVSGGGRQWVQDFIQYTQQNKVPVDFISVHQYGGNSTEYGSIQTILKTFGQVNDWSKKAGLPLVITEYGNTWQARSTVLDEAPTATFVLAVVDAMSTIQPEIFSYWTFTDIFEESGFPGIDIPFHGGFGLMSLYGIPKPAYQAFRLLHKSGTLRLPSKHTKLAKIQTNCDDTVGVLPLLLNVSTHGNNLTVFLYNHATGGSLISQCTVDLTVSSMISAKTSLSNGWMYRIDEDHTNPKQKWIDIGRPQYPTKSEILSMLKASRLEQQKLPTPSSITDTSLVLPISLSPYSVTAVVLPL